jgi:hypothetical protein
MITYQLPILSIFNTEAHAWQPLVSHCSKQTIVAGRSDIDKPPPYVLVSINLTRHCYRPISIQLQC